MAINNEDDLEAQRRLNERSRELTEEDILAREGYAKRADGTIKAIETQTQKRAAIETKINAELEKALGKEKLIYNKRQEQYEKQLESMNYYVDSNRNLVKTTVELDFKQRQQIASLKRSEESANSLLQAQDNLIDNMKKGLGDLTKGMGSFALTLGKGNSSFTTLNPLIDSVSNAMSSLAKAIPFVGEAAAGVIKATAEGSKFVLELMDQNIKSFQEIANSGGLVADGMEGVSRQFLESGMTLDGFKKTVKENARDLAEFGGTVGAGSEKFSKSIGMLTKSDGALADAGMELRKLGMTSDDIGQAASGFLQQEIRLGRARNMNEKQLAEGTAKYAQELDALQKITGLSKEELIKQRNEMMTDSRFGASMDILRETNATGAEAMMKFASTITDPDLKRGFMDLSSGAANTDAAKKALVQMGSTVPDMIEKLRNAKPENVAKVFDEVQSDLKKGAKGYVETFRDAAAVMPDTKTLGNYTTLRDIMNKQNISYEEAIKVQNDQKKANEGLTKDAVSAQQNLERMGQEVFKMGNTLMPKAALAVNKFTDSLKDFVVYVNKLLGPTTEPATSPAGTGGQIQNGSVIGGAGGEGDAGAIMDAAREGQITRSMAPKGRVSFNAARDSQAASVNPTSAQQLSAAGLKIKKGDVQAEGAHVDPRLIEIAKQVQAQIPGFMQFTGFNDQYHNEKASSSLHTKGTAFDFVVAEKPTKEQGEAIVAMMKNLGLDYAQDEYNNASAKATGGHFHGHLKAYDGGVFEGPKSGYNVELHGREAIVPLPDPSSMISVNEGVKKDPLASAMGSSLNMTSAGVDQLAGITQAMMQMMEDKFDAMIDRLSTGNDIQDKLLRNSMV